MRVTEKCMFVAAIAAVALSGTARAAITPINSDAADYQITFAVATSAATFQPASATSVAGYGGTGTPGSRFAGVLIFALPTLGAGNSIGPQTSLTATPTIVTANTSINTDLWGIANFPSATAAANYISYSDSGSDNPNPTATDAKLVDNFFTSTTSVVNTPQTTATGVGNALQAYLQAFYTANPTYDAAVTQRYAFLRLNADANVTGTANRYQVALAESTTAAYRPVLNLDVVVPEPTSLALLGLAAIIGVRRRHR